LKSHFILIVYVVDVENTYYIAYITK